MNDQLEEQDELPKSIGDWILPFRHEDNKAWRKANLLGRICFPAYLLFAAWRTLLFWVLMLALVPGGIFVWITETKTALALTRWLDRLFETLFCKRTP